MKESKVRADGKGSRSDRSKQHSTSTRKTPRAHRAATPAAKINAKPLPRYEVVFPLDGTIAGVFDLATAKLPRFIRQLAERAEERACVTTFDKKDRRELCFVIRMEEGTAARAARLGYLRGEVEEGFRLFGLL
jgi:hypothetical protein